MKRALSIIFFFVTSCDFARTIYSTTDELETFRAKIFLSITSAVELVYLAKKNDLPSPQLVLAYESWTNKEFEMSRFCLFYEREEGGQGEGGKLKLFEIPSSQNCMEKENSKKIGVVSDIRSFGIQLNEISESSPQLIIRGHFKKPKSFREQKIEWSFPLYNIARIISNSPHLQERYAPSREATFTEGLRVMGPKW